MRQLEVLWAALSCAVWAWVATHELALGHAEAGSAGAAAFVFTTVVVAALLLRRD